MKKVIKSVKKEVKSVSIKVVGGNNKGISNFIRDNIVKMGSSKEGLDVKKLDGMLFEKFGVSKSGDNSRINSIRWHLNEMKKKGVIKVG